MNEFNYLRPDSVAAAIKQFAGAADARYLAGGQSLLGAMKLGLAAPDAIVDLGRLRDLGGIRVEGNVVRVGAMTTHAAVAASADVRAKIPGLARLAAGIGDPSVRSRGTLGGSLANNDPAACYPAGVLALGATIETDRRKIAADDFFLGLYETALQAGEVIVAVHFPIAQNAAYAKFEQPASRFALVGVCVARGAQGVRVAVTGAKACVFRVAALEQALAKNFSPGACDGVAIASDGMNRDLHASPEYRAHLVTVLAKRAVAASL